MPNIKKILVGIDFKARNGRLTQGSKSAIRKAARLADTTGATVHFLHSEQRNPEEERGEEYDAEVGEVQWRAFCEKKGLANPVWIVSQEPAWLALIHQVTEEDYDLVVVAKRNRSRRMDRKLGSVSMRLLRKCPCSVLVVQPDYEHDDGPVLVATDLSPVGDKAVEWAATLAELENHKLWIVHSWQMPLELQLGPSGLTGRELQTHMDSEIEAVRAEINALPCVARAGERAKVAIAMGVPSEGIVKVEHKIEPCLTVLGSMGRGGIAGFLLGNTAERLIYRLESSLLVVKPDDFVCPVA